MENIVRLAEYRKRRQAQRAAAPAVSADTGSQYFCTRCDSDQFRLTALGMVHCAHCSALMRNLLVSPTSSGEANQ